MIPYPRFIPYAVHAFADYSVIAALIIFFSKYNFEIGIPAILGAMTFDIYLVHYKILMLSEYHSLNHSCLLSYSLL